MSVIEGRWKVVVLCKLKEKGEMRFNQIMREIEGISPRMLAKQLKELERDGLLYRNVHYEIPPRVQYSLTELGKSLIPLLSEMTRWGLNNLMREIIEIRE
ncbi:MAG: helix-turn-helix transcriptional regulator [Methanomassiliicoccaceae archaeon]|nr:helix-turn-helix transcriptional regulator [Methanomassiliicoccaceae archaeon]